MSEQRTEFTPPQTLLIDGRLLKFVRVASKDKSGGVPLSQLKADECVVSPGWIYREVSR